LHFIQVVYRKVEKIGLSSYSNEAPLDSSMLSHFRQRIGMTLVNQINESMVRKNEEKNSAYLEENQKKSQNKEKKSLQRIKAN
jgi:hypothetical protein